MTDLQQISGQPVIDIFLPTYRTEPAENEKFYPSKAKAVIDKVLKEQLEGQLYDEDYSRHLSLRISDLIRENIQELLWNSRYKIIVQTTIGQMRDQGINIASRCLWDPNFDNYASSQYTNCYGICVVYGLVMYFGVKYLN